jgi:hypothetical protein
MRFSAVASQLLVRTHKLSCFGLSPSLCSSFCFVLCVELSGFFSLFFFCSSQLSSFQIRSKTDLLQQESCFFVSRLFVLMAVAFFPLFSLRAPKPLSYIYIPTTTTIPAQEQKARCVSITVRRCCFCPPFFVLLFLFVFKLRKRTHTPSLSCIYI